MKKYQIQNSIGNGNFSKVYKGVLLPDHTPCAIKILKQHHNIAVRQAQLLKKFRHPNIISIIDFEQTQNQSRIVLQYMGINTLQLYEAHPNGLKQQQVKCILFQVALGLSCVHSYHIIHRDIKPQNILIDKRLAIVKIIDFGLAIQQNRVSTDYIATRWYRAPENLLGTKQYTCAIDVFSLGCVIFELYTGLPLFPGANNLDQILKIFSILGYPNQTNWAKGHEKMTMLGIVGNNKITQTQSNINLKAKLGALCDPLLLDLIQKMLQLNPKNRITCLDILKHPYFKNIKSIIPPLVFKRFQEDILSNKSVNFKGFQPARSSRSNNNNNQINNQMNPKHSKINFHNNVSAKIKHIQHQPQQLPSIVVQKPNSLRQQKSSSVHSFQLVPSFVNQPQRPFNGNRVQVMNLNRKFSTPTLMTHNNQKYQTFSQRSSLELVPLAQMRNQSLKDLNSGSSSLRKSQMSIPNQITNSFIANEIGQINSSQPFFKRLNQRKSIQILNNNIQKNMQASPLILNSSQARLPIMNNVPFVAEQQPVFNQSNSQLKFSIKQFNKIKDNTQKPLNSSLIKSYEQQKSPMNISIKQNILNQSYRSPLQTSANTNSNQFPQEGYQRFIDNKQFKQQGKKIRNFPEVRNNGPQFFHRQNFAFPGQNINKLEHILRKPQINYRSPNNFQAGTKQIFLSPSPRPIGNPTPQLNNFNIVRQRRLHAVNSPLQQFYSPPPRK